MRVASRLMPTYQPKPIGPLGWIVMAALACAFIYIVASEPKAVSVVLALLFFGFLVSRRAERRVEERLREVAAAREGESICEFARAFDPKVVDTWVIRAVYEQLQKQFEHVHPSFPLRAEDRLKEDLHLDDDDLDLDVAVQVEERTGRSLDNTGVNPYRGSVRTVRDLVMFFQAQPQHGAA
jgi:hypothetical protein